MVPLSRGEEITSSVYVEGWLSASSSKVTKEKVVCVDRDAGKQVDVVMRIWRRLLLTVSIFTKQ